MASHPQLDGHNGRKGRTGRCSWYGVKSSMHGLLGAEHVATGRVVGHAREMRIYHRHTSRHDADSGKHVFGRPRCTHSSRMSPTFVPLPVCSPTKAHKQDPHRGPSTLS